MTYVNLGKSGLKVSRICLGTMTYGSSKWRDWVLDEQDARPIYRRAIEAGINFFDTADMYSSGVSEEVTGRALKEFATGRDKVVIATKVSYPMGDGPNMRGLSRKHIVHAIEDSLRRLQTDYIDLYQVHRFDPNTPIEETLEALDLIVRAGKALYIGASSMYAWQFLTMLNASEKMGVARFITMQNHYNLIYREEEREMIPLCLANGIGIIPYSPLARGFLAGNRDGGQSVRSKTDTFGRRLYFKDSDYAVMNCLTEIAARRGVDSPLVALAWILSKPGVSSPVIGATKMVHLEGAIQAVDMHLDPDEIKALEEPYETHPAAWMSYDSSPSPTPSR